MQRRGQTDVKTSEKDADAVCRHSLSKTINSCRRDNRDGEEKT